MWPLFKNSFIAAVAAKLGWVLGGLIAQGMRWLVRLVVVAVAGTAFYSAVTSKTAKDFANQEACRSVTSDAKSKCPPAPAKASSQGGNHVRQD